MTDDERAEDLADEIDEIWWNDKFSQLWGDPERFEVEYTRALATRGDHSSNARDTSGTASTVTEAEE